MNPRQLESLWQKYIAGDALTATESCNLVSAMDLEPQLLGQFADERIVDAMLQFESTRDDDRFVSDCVAAIVNQTKEQAADCQPSCVSKTHHADHRYLWPFAAAIALLLVALVTRPWAIPNSPKENLAESSDSRSHGSLSLALAPVDAPREKPIEADRPNNRLATVIGPKTQMQVQPNLAADHNVTPKVILPSAPSGITSKEQGVDQPSPADSIELQIENDEPHYRQPESITFATLVNINELQVKDGVQVDRLGNQKVEFTSGQGLIRFDNNVEIRFIAPAVFELTSQRQAHLVRGQYQCLIPREVERFSILTKGFTWEPDGRADFQIDSRDHESVEGFVYRGRINVRPIQPDKNREVTDNLQLSDNNLNQVLLAPGDVDSIPTIALAKGKSAFLGQIGVGPNAWRTERPREFIYSAQSITTNQVSPASDAFQEWLQAMRQRNLRYGFDHNALEELQKRVDAIFQEIPNRIENSGDGTFHHSSFMENLLGGQPANADTLTFNGASLRFSPTDHFKAIRKRFKRQTLNR